MPVRIPAARASEGVAFGLAGVGAFAPFYFMAPSASDRMAAQTVKWAPRWERNITYFSPGAERIAKRIEPPTARAVKKIERTLHLEQMAQGLERRIRYGVDKFGNKFGKH